MDVFTKAYKAFYKSRRWTGTILATALAAKNGVPHLFPTHGFMPFHASFMGSQFPLDHMVLLLKSTKAELGVTDPVLPFVTTRADVVSAGFSAFSKIKPPSSIGIPKNYFCSNIFELDDLNITVGTNEKKLTTYGPSERMLLESLILSESAQKFAIARHIAYLKQNWAILQSFLPSFFVALGYVACFYGPRLLFSGTSPVFILTIVRYTIACIFITWVACKLAKAMLTHKIVNSVDRKAAMISKEYAEGGIEYYEKLCSRNKANRALLGKKGEKMFTVFGNQVDGLLVNWNGPTLTERISNIKNISKSF
uniref:Transmembrane protein 177 n=1 Tax=Phallusia mammillata TaxID=59560 RepID=A0A6F9DUE6_9ASCI|nr:transmembrane protein 177-like [Phallusia mammillata]